MQVLKDFIAAIVIPKTLKKNFSDPVIIFKCMFTFFYNVFLSVLILKAGNIELNPGPKKILIHISLVAIGTLID